VQSLFLGMKCNNSGKIIPYLTQSSLALPDFYRPHPLKIR
jgi:hypothetical protein